MTDRRMQRLIGRLLQAGVLLSAAVVAAGGAWLLVESGHSTPNYRRFQGVPAALRSIPGLLTAQPSPEVVVQWGLFLLIATPVARVILSLIGFALQRDRAYVWITLTVLAVLAYSLAVPH